MKAEIALHTLDHGRQLLFAILASIEPTAGNYTRECSGILRDIDEGANMAQQGLPVGR